MNNRELEERLIAFSVEVVNWTGLPYKNAALYSLKEQIFRSVTSAALNYGESQSAESKKDFIHKIGIVMKELRETQINLKIMSRLQTGQNESKIKALIAENDELLAIFFKTLQTAKKR